MERAVTKRLIEDLSNKQQMSEQYNSAVLPNLIAIICITLQQRDKAGAFLVLITTKSVFSFHRTINLAVIMRLNNNIVSEKKRSRKDCAHIILR